MSRVVKQNSVVGLAASNPALDVCDLTLGENYLLAPASLFHVVDDAIRSNEMRLPGQIMALRLSMPPLTVFGCPEVI